MEATPEDLLGKSDTVLDAAVKRLKEGAAKTASGQ
jgi:hypothetical protein